MKYLLVLAVSLVLAGCEKIPVEAVTKVPPERVTLNKMFRSVTEVCYDGYMYIVVQADSSIGFSPKIVSSPALAGIGTTPTFEKCE